MLLQTSMINKILLLKSVFRQSGNRLPTVWKQSPDGYRWILRRTETVELIRVRGRLSEEKRGRSELNGPHGLPVGIREAGGAFDHDGDAWRADDWDFELALLQSEVRAVGEGARIPENRRATRERRGPAL